MTPSRRLPAVAALALTGLFGAVAAGDAGARPLLTFQDPGIAESSGLADLGETLLTVNDSGSAAVVHLVDKATGETVGRTTYAEDVADVEAVAVGPDGAVWVGDIGDNGGRRMSIAVHRLDPVSPGDRTVAATRYDLGYVGGPRDAEALLVHPDTGRLFVVGKGLLGGHVWAAPRHLRTGTLNVLRPVGPSGSLVTDGAFLPDGNHVVLRSYTGATLRDARTWEAVASMPLPRQQQGEGLAVTDGQRLLLSSEGQHSEVLVVPLADELRAALDDGPEQPTTGRDDRQDRTDVGAGSEEPAGWLVPAAAVLAAGLAVALLVWVVPVVRAARRRGRSTR